MAKKGIIVGGIAAIIIFGIIASSGVFDSGESSNLDMSRTHGTVSTAMGSPILGSPDAPITIIEFGDYQCHQCYNWFHNTKPTIESNYIEAGKAKALGLNFVKTVIKGSEVSDKNEFDGLQTRLGTGSQTIDNGTSALSLLKLDQLLDEVDSPTHLLMNKTMRRAIPRHLQSLG